MDHQAYLEEIRTKRAKFIDQLVVRTRPMKGRITAEQARASLLHVCTAPHVHDRPYCTCRKGVLAEGEIATIIDRAWSEEPTPCMSES